MLAYPFTLQDVLVSTQTPSQPQVLRPCIYCQFSGTYLASPGSYGLTSLRAALVSVRMHQAPLTYRFIH